MRHFSEDPRCALVYMNMLLLNFPFPWYFFCAVQITCLLESIQVKFDQFVEQGRVLHNYASILELLLRLRQCCDHPFLVLRCVFNSNALD